MILKRRKRAKMGVREPSRVVCPSHLKWTRGHACCIDSVVAQGEQHFCQGRIEAHHVTTRGAGGGDETVVPLCTKAHGLVHSMGCETFGKTFGVDLEQIAAGLWRASPHRRKYELEHSGEPKP